MSNEVATTAVVPSKASLLKGALGKLKESSQNAPTAQFRYLTFNGQTAQYASKDTQGDPQILAVPTKMAVNFAFIEHGYVCWKDGKVIDQTMSLLMVDPVLPAIEDMPDHGPYAPAKPGNSQRDGWKIQFGLPLKDVETGVEYLYKTTSPSSARAVQSLVAKMAEDAVLKDLEKVVPIINMSADSYIAKASGAKVNVPKFRIDKWEDASKYPMRETPYTVGNESTEQQGESAGEESAGAEVIVNQAKVKVARKG